MKGQGWDSNPQPRTPKVITYNPLIREEQVERLELSLTLWKSVAQPLGQTRITANNTAERLKMDSPVEWRRIES